jgi:hypothetical protein
MNGPEQTNFMTRAVIPVEGEVGKKNGQRLGPPMFHINGRELSMLLHHFHGEEHDAGPEEIGRDTNVNADGKVNEQIFPRITSRVRFQLSDLPDNGLAENHGRNENKSKASKRARVAPLCILKSG